MCINKNQIKQIKVYKQNLFTFDRGVPCEKLTILFQTSLQGVNSCKTD